MASAVNWVEPHKGIETGHFRTLIKSLDALSKANTGSPCRTKLTTWLASVSSGAKYIDFLRALSSADRNDAWIKQVDECLAGENGDPSLLFHPGAKCWTFRLSLEQQKKAKDGYQLAKRMILAVIKHQAMPEVMALFEKYFGATPVATVVQKYVAVLAAFDDNRMDVLCKGSKKRAGKRAVAYVDEAGDAQILHPTLEASSRCTYLTSIYFAKAEETDDVGMGLDYHLKPGSTIIHELTHHILKTNDEKLDGVEAYGRYRCWQLAERSEDRALTNADSFALLAQDVGAWERRMLVTATAVPAKAGPEPVWNVVPEF